MQDRYAGDIGDFGKYGLLRFLTGVTSAGPSLRLGVVWYLVDDRTVASDPPGDGRHTGYLSPSKARPFSECDPELHEQMRDVVGRSQRLVSSVETLGVLPDDTVFSSYRIRTPSRGVSKRDRLASREQWVRRALDDTRFCDVVFLDPDNGIEGPSVRPHYKRAPKHVFFSELEAYAARGQSLVIYHHLGRRKPHAVEIADRLEELTARLSPEGDPFAMHFRRGTARAFFVVPAGNHTRLLSDRSRAFLDGPWERHFDRVEPDSATP